MKKNTMLFAALAAIAIISCDRRLDIQEIPETEDSAAVFTASTEAPATKTALEQDGEQYNVNWQNGDRITIVDAASHVGVYSTTSTTTQGAFTYVPESGAETVTAPYKAWYPAGIYGAGTPALPATQDYVAGNISGLPMYAEGGTTNLAFKNLGGIIRLNISTTQGGKKVRRIELSANEGMSGAITNAATLASSEYVATVSGTAGVTLDCGVSGVAISNVATSFHIAVPANTYTGLKITVVTTDGEVQTRTLKSDREIVVSRSSITTITIPFNDLYTDLSAAQTANAYIVSAAGKYKFRATVKGNGSANLGGISKDTDAGSIASADLVWATFNTAVAPSAGELIKDIHYADGYVYFSTGDVYKEGNALVAIKDGSGNILWSWHIWLHNYAETYLTGANSVQMMDRDLGALSTNVNSPLSYGLYYQWGRKDPFVGPSSGTIIAAVSGSAKSIEVGAVSVATAVLHPANYYVAVNSAGRWINGDHWCSADSKMSLWSDSGKTIFDPCPPGWRLPSLSEITGMGGNSYFSGGNGFPPSGYFGTEGAFYSPGNGTLWSTTVDGQCAKIQVLYAAQDVFSRSPDMGFNLRCVRESQ